MTAPLRPWRFFVWLIVPVAAFVFYLMAGLPHVIWSYEIEANGSPYDPDIPRRTTRCTYVGPYGPFTASPVAGACPWVRFFRDGENAG